MYIVKQSNLTRFNTLSFHRDRYGMMDNKNPSVYREQRDLFTGLYIESQVPLPGKPFHNPYINYYSHEYYEGDLDTLPVYTPSQLFIFKYIKGDFVCNYRCQTTAACTTDQEMLGSAIDIYSPRKINSGKLLSVCRTISKHQPTTHLWLKKLHNDNFPQPDVFTMSGKAESVTIEHCKLPPYVLSHLFDQLTKCTDLQSFEVDHTHLGTLTSLALINMVSLTHLSLSSTLLSPDLCSSVIQQLGDLPKLVQVDLSYNCLTGLVCKFIPDPHPGLPSLQVLDLKDNALNKKDLIHLTHLIQSEKLPELRALGLEGTIVPHIMETLLDNLVEACITHHQREISLILWNNSLTREFKDKWMLEPILTSVVCGEF